MASSADPDLEMLRLGRRDLAKLVGIGLGQAAGVVALVLLVREAVDRMQATPFDARGMVPVIAGLAGAALLISGLRAAEYAVSESVGFDYVRSLRMHMYDHLQGMTPHQIASRSRGGVILRFTGDLSTLRTWISRGLARGIVAAIVLTAGVAVTFALNLATGAALACVLAVGTVWTVRTGTELRRRTRTVRRRRSLLTSNVVEQVSSLGVVQVFGRAAGERSRLDRHNTSLTKALERAARTRARLRGISSATALAGLVVVVAVGTVELDRGRADVGTIVAGVTAIRYLTGPVRSLGLSHDYWQGAQVSRAKVVDFLRAPATPLAPPDSERLRVRTGAIDFHDVSVSGALRHVDLCVPGGAMVALTGPNGAGKSTMLSVVARFVEPDSGEVVIDGQALASVSRQSTYRHIGMVSSDLPLMAGTLRRNLTYRFRDAPPEEIERIILACRLDELLDTLPNGLDTWLREGGQNLSLGFRQRVALARAILGSPRILLLDEATSNLDAASKEVFRRVLAGYSGTVLLATHDVAEAALADTVVTLDDGAVVDIVAGSEYRLLHPDRPSGPLARW